MSARSLARLALRSLVRNRRRSIITLAAVAVGVAVVIFAHGFGEGLMRMMVRNSLDNRLGAMQVHARGYLEASEAAPLKLDLPHFEELMAKAAQVPGVVAVTPRIRFGALVGNGRTSSIVIAEAIDPEREMAVCPGRRAEVDEKAGAFVSQDRPRAGVIGAELARSLQVKRDDLVTLSAAGREGAQNALDLEVGGVSKGASSFLESKRVVLVPLAYAQELLQMQGRVTELAVRVDEIERIPTIAADLQRALGNDVEVSRWDEVMPFLRDAVARLGIVLRGISAVLFFIVVFGVVNTMLMNVYERTREIGTLMAVGVRRRQILTLFLFEAAVIGVMGGLLGAVAGLAGTLAASAKGITITPPGALFAQIIHPVARFDLAAGAIVVAVVGAVLAAAWPAYKASRMNPVEALRPQ
jgi:putative ABC transport system permease protein